MKILKQICIIFTICWLSVILERCLPLPIPASVIGLILLFLCLAAGIIKLGHIQEKSDFLLSNMAFFFIPAGVGMMNYFDILQKNWFPLLAICILSTLVTFAATAYSIRLTLKLMDLKLMERRK